MPRYNCYGNGHGGACDIYDPPESYWCSSNADGGGGEVDRAGPYFPIGKNSIFNGTYNF